MFRLVGGICLLCCGFQVHADMLGVRLGLETWQAQPSDVALGDVGFAGTLPLSAQTQHAFLLKFEHPLPLIPNLAMRRQTLTGVGSGTLAQDIRVNQTEFAAGDTISHDINGLYHQLSAYYQLLDNQIFSLDLGPGIRQLHAHTALSMQSSVTAQQSFTRWIPLVFVEAELAIWGTDAAVFYQAEKAVASNAQLDDWRLGVQYRWLDVAFVQGYVRLGYQEQSSSLPDVDSLVFSLRQRGGFIALEMDF